MDFTQLSKTYQVKKLNKNNLEELMQLCLGNSLFYEFCPPKPTFQSLLEDMKKLPPHKTQKDKYYIGFFEENQLIAVMDLILAYPNASTAFIGFFMVHKEVQGRGIGRLIIKETSQYLSKDFQSLRLGYVLGNPQSEAFWLKQGFQKTGIIVQEELYTIVVLEKELEG